VEARNSAGEYDARIIVISEDYLVEADVVSAVDVLKLALKHLVKVEDVTKSNVEVLVLLTSLLDMTSAKPIVQLEFRVSLVDRTQHTICVSFSSVNAATGLLERYTKWKTSSIEIN
jgi:hypothetical protein